ncbi:hypothetical protein VaNZ11_014006 [Volvox africanus]|uniref:J domain-containing protein n=1 Tax=Volvox africanus TaxID=51714 RepID=A0ABQ5SHI2_9CHLO|nr:hypothetical protein VaNZ11_014006 [Volvox africanus]
MSLLIARLTPTRVIGSPSAAPQRRQGHSRNPVVSTAAHRTHYEVLGLDYRATPDDIRSAFRRLAKEKHPDVSQDNKAEEEFMRLKLAYDILSDSATRAQYDMLLTQRKRSTTATRQRTSSVSSDWRATSTRGYGVSRRGDDRSAASPYRAHSPHPQQQPPGPAPPGADDWMPSSSSRSRSSRTPPPSRPSWYGRPVNRSGGTSVRGTSASRASQAQSSTSSPNWGDDWGSWAASTRSNTTAGRSMAGGTTAASPPPPSPPPSGPMSGDDWTSTYARVAVGSPDIRTNPGRVAATATATAAAVATSSYDEWGNSDSPLSSGDDLEWYSDVVVAAAGAGSGAARATTSTSSASASATGAGITTPAAATASAVAASKGDDFDLFSAVAATAVPSAAAAAADGAGSGAAAVPPPPPSFVPSPPAPPSVVPTGDDFVLFASVAAAAPLPASTRPTPSPPRRRTSTSFQGASSVWENSSSTPAMASAATDPSATAAALEAKPETAEELSATETAPVAPAVSCTAVNTLKPVPLSTRPTDQGDKADTASRSDVISSVHVAAESRNQSASTSVASDPTAMALAAAHAAAVAAAAAIAATTVSGRKSVRAPAAADATVAATVAGAAAAKATTPAVTPTATASANDITTSIYIAGKDGVEVLSRRDSLGAASTRVVDTVEATPPASPLDAPAVGVIVGETRVDAAAVAADAPGRHPGANVLQAPPPPPPAPAADPVNGGAERSEDQRNDEDVMAVAESAGDAVAIGVQPAAEANAHPATATAAPPDSLASAPMAAAVPDSAATEDVQYGTAPPPLTFWKQSGISYNPDFLAAAIAAASVVTSRLPAAGPGDGVSDSDAAVPPGYASGHVPATTAAAAAPSDAGQEAQEPQEKPGNDGAEDKAQESGDNEQAKDLQPAAAPVAGLSFSDAVEASEGWRRSYSPIKSAGIYFNDQGLGGGAGSIFSPKTQPSPPKSDPGSIFGSPPPPPPAPGNRR